MGNRGNLQLFKAGKSGNPSGRPKGSRNRATVVQEVFEMHVGGDFNLNPLTGLPMPGVDVETMLVLAQVAQARRGNTDAFRALFDSRYGKPTATIEINRTEEEVLQRDPREMTEQELREAVALAQELRSRRLAASAEDAELAGPEAEVLPAAGA